MANAYLTNSLPKLYRNLPNRVFYPVLLTSGWPKMTYGTFGHLQLEHAGR